jgi:hypothetical protein
MHGRDPAHEPGIVWDAWRDGDQLVLGPDAQLPDRCVKTDLPAKGNRAEVVAIWHDPALYWLLLLSPIVYLIVVRSIGTRVLVTVGILPEALRAARRDRVLTWVLLGGGVAAWLAAAVLPALVYFWLGLALMALAVPVYLLGARLVRVTRLEDDRVWMRGVHPAYLARLPELPH